MNQRGFLVVSELIIGDDIQAPDSAVEDAFVAYIEACDTAAFVFRRALLAHGDGHLDTLLDMRPIAHARARAICDRAKPRIFDAAAQRYRDANETLTTRDDLDRSGPGHPVAVQPGRLMRCTDVYRDSKARGCRLPLDHEGACDARFVRVAAAPWDDDDESDAVLERGIVRDDEMRREER